MLATLLQAALVLIPVGVAALVVRLLAGPTAGLPWWGRFLVAVGVAAAAALLADRYLRRFLPLAALLRMTMLFPDRAPSRLAVARRVGHPQALLRAAASPDETLGQAAERILVLITTLGTHDRRTRGHSERVRVFTDLISEQLGLGQADRDRLRWAALLHDLGKVDVPAAVLNKPGRLDTAEWELIRRHPARGTELAGSLGEWLGPWAAAIGEHHERYDGMGYPLGLRGQDIALAGRIVAVADAFEVMTAARSYKRPMSVRAARAELARVAGTQLDPRCVRALLAASLPRLLWAVGPVSLLVNLPFLRSVADAGRMLDGSVAVAGGQAVTTAAAALTGMAVIAAPAASALPTPRPAAAAAASSATPTATPTPAPSAITTAPAPGPTSVLPTAPGPVPSALLRPRTVPPAAPRPTSTSGRPGAPAPGATASPSRPAVTARPGPHPSTAPPSPVASRPTSPTPTPAEPERDRTDPTLRITSAPALRLLSTTATISFVSDDPTARFYCRLDSGSWRSCTSPATFTGLKLGDHKIEVYAIDPAGNESDKKKVEFLVVSLFL